MHTLIVTYKPTLVRAKTTILSQKMNKQKILIYDLETSSTDPALAIPSVMGFYSSETDDSFKWTDDIATMVNLINEHDVIVGYNNQEYDDVIMARYGARFKVNVDLLKIVHGSGFGNDKGRKSIIMTPDGDLLSEVCHSKKLEELSPLLGGPEKLSGDVDYAWFRQPLSTLPPEIHAKALTYVEHDLLATRHIYEYMEAHFSDIRDGGIEIDGVFKKFMSTKNVVEKKYLVSSVASMTYKIICNLTGLPEVYNDAKYREDFDGGFVAPPTQESAQGNIYCLDYNSLYPHIMIMHNLYGQGDISKMHPVCDVLQQIFNLRAKYKQEKDSRQYTLKIIINTMYGLLGNPIFTSVSDYKAAAKCTSVGQEWCRLARKIFSDAGYNVLYSDTDSVYLQDPFGDKGRLIRTKQKIVDTILDSVPFKSPTFDMGIDEEIDYIAFFKGADGQLKKKNYLYVTKSGKVEIKGLSIKKRDSIPLARHIYLKYIEPDLRTYRCRHKWPKAQIEKWVADELRTDILLAAKSVSVKPADQYSAKTNYLCKISERLGEGRHKIFKLRQAHEKGMGKNADYVSAKEVTPDIYQLDLSGVFVTLAPFIEEQKENTLETWI